MSQHQARLSRRRPAVFPFGDLDVRSTDSGGNGFNQDRALAHIGLRKIFVPDCPGLFRFYSNRFHGVTSFLGTTYCEVPRPEGWDCFTSLNALSHSSRRMFFFKSGIGPGSLWSMLLASPGSPKTFD